MQNFEETKTLFNNSSLFYIISTDMDGKYSFINEHYAKQFSHVDTTLVGKPYYITMHPDDRNTCIEVSTKCFENPTKLFPATIRKHDGEGGYVYTQWEYKAMLDDKKNPAGIFCLGYNITKYVGEELQLQKANEKIEQNSNTLKNIIFQQSHLVRAPLSNIIGLTSILDKTLLDSNTSNICDMILESSRQLDEIIKSIVTNART
ncbi:PAS domain-containing protein [Flavobacterium xinjiangense]|uniref:histidine kinase n=1 Tax=Flavobacterium xinjiangense TaxID=178356 RepID=A0A1M7F9E5_9FLAO|nr:PAS domain-containing protein [Flavobacterium xinjiangense]SHM00297.1 PAS fold-containing protein [Flavobacterium xinjiangense]